MTDIKQNGTEVVRITQEGYGDSPGQLPKEYKNHIESFKTKKHYSPHRCPRSLFVPFTTEGFIKKNIGVTHFEADERVDGLRVPSKRFPIFLFMHFKKGKLVGTAVVQKRSPKLVKLIYLCGAPAAKGVGKALLQDPGPLKYKSSYYPNKPTYAKLNDDSGENGYYTKRGWKIQPKSVQYGTKAAPKKLKVYKQSLLSKPKGPKTMSISTPMRSLPSFSGLSYNNMSLIPSSLVLTSPPPKRALKPKPKRFVRSAYGLRHPYFMRQRL